MKKILLALALLVTVQAIGQYTIINSGYDWLRGKFQALNLPGTCGYPSLKAGQSVGDGGITLDTCNRRLYIYQNGVWWPLTDSAQLGLKLNISDTAGMLANYLRQVPLSILKNASAANSLSNGSYRQDWNWNNIGSGTAMAMTLTGSTSGTTGTLLELSSRNNPGIGATRTLLNVINGGTGQPGINIGARFSAYGRSTNYAIMVDSGDVIIGKNPIGTAISRGRLLVYDSITTSSLSNGIQVWLPVAYGKQNSAPITLQGSSYSDSLGNAVGQYWEQQVVGDTSYSGTGHSHYRWRVGYGTAPSKEIFGFGDKGQIYLQGDPGTNTYVLQSQGPNSSAIWAPVGGGMSNPMTTSGDLIIGGSGGTPARLAIGSEGSTLKVVSGVPAWSTEAGSNIYNMDGTLDSIRSVDMDTLSLTFKNNGLFRIEDADSIGYAGIYDFQRGFDFTRYSPHKSFNASMNLLNGIKLTANDLDAANTVSATVDTTGVTFSIPSSKLKVNGIFNFIDIDDATGTTHFTGTGDFNIQHNSIKLSGTIPVVHGDTTGTKLLAKRTSDNVIVGVDWPVGGGAGTNNYNIGSGYRWLLPGTQEIKTAFAGLYMAIDSSSNTNGLTFKVDSSNLLTKVRSIIASSVPGSNGNLIINRNGLFAAPGSDSINWSAANLNIKGTLTTTGTITSGASQSIYSGGNVVANSGNSIFFGSVLSNVGYVNGPITISPLQALIISPGNSEQWRFNTSANGGTLTNTGGVGSAKLHFTGTGEQLRFGYDGSNYLKSQVNSTGTITWDLVGTSPTFNFSDKINAVGGLRIPSLSTAVSADTILVAEDGDVKALGMTAGGSFTPTRTAVSNVSSTSGYTCYYTRIGDWVHVWGAIDITATASGTPTEVGLSLPVASSVSEKSMVGGTAASGDDIVPIQIIGDTSNNRAKLIYISNTTSTRTYSFNFSYYYQAP